MKKICLIVYLILFIITSCSNSYKRKVIKQHKTQTFRNGQQIKAPTFDEWYGINPSQNNPDTIKRIWIWNTDTIKSNEKCIQPITENYNTFDD